MYRHHDLLSSTPSPRITQFPLARIPLPQFFAYLLVSGDFRISRGPPTVLLTRISSNAVYFKSQNPRKAGTPCILFCYPFTFGGRVINLQSSHLVVVRMTGSQERLLRRQLGDLEGSLVLVFLLFFPVGLRFQSPRFAGKSTSMV